MSYSKEDLVRELEAAIGSEYDPVRIAKVAFQIYHLHNHEISRDVHELLMDLVVMEEGKEFEMSEAEFKELLDSLRS